MKVIILGASGIVGRSLSALFATKKISWVGTYNTSSFEHGIKLSKTDKESLSILLKQHNITHCINCVADRNVDNCEKDIEGTMEINCWFASRLAEVTSQLNIYLVHISTDYVFDGTHPPYLPDSTCCPIQSYGLSKRRGEEEIMNANKEACIVRAPALYTQRFTSLQDSVVTSIGKKVMDRTKSYSEDNYLVRRPVFIDDLCEFLVECLRHQRKGIFHFYNTKDKATKYEIASMIASYLNKPTCHITPLCEHNKQGGRPYDTHLIDTQYNRSDYPDTSLKEGIISCFQEFMHPKLNINAIPTPSVFYMLDLDGTLVNTDFLHYTSYKKAFETYGYNMCDWDTYNKLQSIEIYCKESLKTNYTEIKTLKQKILLEEDQIEFMPGAELFIQWLVATNQNVVIVTNTTRQTVEFFQQKLPLLQKITQWITREDVTNPKPHGEPYSLAKERFWKGEQYCIGFENTISGYKSLSTVTPIIYILCNNSSYVYASLYKYNLYFISDFRDIFIPNET